MSWSHSSRLGIVLLSLLVLVAAVGVASAVSVSDEQAPEEATAGEEVTVSVELQDLFADESSWELSGQTELDNAEWTIELRENGELSDTREDTGGELDPIYLEDGITDADTIVVEITGDTPEVTNTSYADPATILLGEVVQLTDGGNDPTYLSQHEVSHYSSGDPGSQEARTALDDADAAIQSAADGGADVSEAQSTFDEAVSAYNSAEFSDAVSLAEEAQSQAESAGSSDDGSSSNDGSGSDDGSGSEDGSSDGTTDDGSADGADGGTTNESDADGNTSQNDADGGNETDDGSSDSDDGGLLWPILYGLFGLLILGGILGGVYLYQQQKDSPNRDPLG